MKNTHRLFTFLVMLSMIISLFSAPAFTGSTVRAQAEIPTATPETAQPPVEPAPSATAEPGPVPTDQPTEKPEVVPLFVEKSDAVIPGQFIVVYKDGANVTDLVNAATSDVTASGGNIKFVYTSAIQGFAAQLSPEMLKTLRQDPRIAYIEADQVVTISDEDGPSIESVQNSPTWGLDRIDQHSLPLNSQYFYQATAGAGVNVYVIDTGIRTTHVEFGGRASLDFDAFVDGNNGVDCGSTSGHGTHVAGTIGGSTYGVAKNVTLHAVRVLGCDGSGSWSGVIAGINWVKLNAVKPAVANMSLGGGVSAAVDAAVASAVASGVTFAVAAGNENTNACLRTPARTPSAITVGATDNTDFRASFSNYGTCLDIFAPGVNITSALNTGNSDTATASWNGTSMATPHVAGAVALYLAGNPTASPATVAAYLVAQSTKNVVLNPVGSANRLLFISNGLTAAPVLVAPVLNGLTNDSTPALSWKSTFNAETYQVQLSISPLFTGAAILDAGASTSYSPVIPLADGKWYWRARAVDISSATGAWSPSRYFTLDTSAPAAPVLNLPANGSSTVGTPTFSWKASLTATRYQFGYNSDGNPGTPFLYESPELATLTHKPPTMALNKFYWFARAKDPAGNWSAWSAPFTVIITPPVPLAPVLDAPVTNFFTNDTTPELKWKSVPYGATYELQIDEAATFTAPLEQDTEGIGGLSLSADTLAEGKYFWRVRARNANSVYGPWSLVRNFTVDTTAPAAPVLNLPGNGTSFVGTPTFSWKVSLTAIRYQFEYNTSGINPASDYIYRSAELSTLNHKPPTMAPNTTYYWFVSARDLAGNWSAWSAPFSVTVTPPVPAAPLLSAPITGFKTDETSLVLSWLAVAYGHTYEVQIDDLASFASPNYTYTSGVGIPTVTTGTLATGKWYWRVRSLNINSVPSLAWSASRFFTILPKFDTQFNTGGNFENWESHFGGWGVSSGSLSTGGLNGYYTSSASYAGATNFTDFTYQARMKMDFDPATPAFYLQNSYGLVVRGTPSFNSYNDWRNGYYFMIGNFQEYDGTKHGMYTVMKMTNGVYTNLSNGYWYSSGAINVADWNTLKVTANGSSLKFYVNDNLIWSKTVAGPTIGRLGVFTWRATGLVESTYVDWATAGAPIISSLSEQVVADQQPVPGILLPKNLK